MTQPTPLEALEILHIFASDKSVMPEPKARRLMRIVRDAIDPPHADRKYSIGQVVRKTKGSNWQGAIVGFYSTSLTPIGYAVESSTEHGSVQIYPQSALELVDAELKRREAGE